MEVLVQMLLSWFSLLGTLAFRHPEVDSRAELIFFGIRLNASSFAWLKQVEYFTTNPNYSILVFDNRGSGNSTSPKGLYKTSQMAQDAVVLLDHLGWRDERSLIVVGASMGGMISMDLVSRLL